MLSAVSQQVQTIQEALKSHQEGDNTGMRNIKMLHGFITYTFSFFSSLVSKIH